MMLLLLIVRSISSCQPSSVFVWQKAQNGTGVPFKRTSSASRVIASYAAFDSITEGLSDRMSPVVTQ